ncbi:MAG TPA: hypothetical protein DCZ93_10505, partial [Elusimicrobia bacterium]|nr:hypothetical protein [Elusimicrobiota bacterium]
MKKTTALLMTILFLAQNPLFIYAAENALVRSVRVSAESVYITTDKPVKYKAFAMSQPPKLVVELEDARLRTLEEIPVNSVFIKKVRTGQFRTSPVSVSRVVLELTQKAVYDITQKGNELVVVLGGKFGPGKSGLKDAPAAAEPAAEGVKVITPSSQDNSPELSTISVKAANPNRENIPVIVPQARPLKTDRISRSIMDNLPTDPVNLDYSEANVRDIIGMLAAKAGINIIYSDDVTGTTSINLNKVPFDEAFRTILNVNGLAAQQVGDNILRIASPQTFMAEQKKAFLQTRVFFLNYSRAAEVKTQLTAVAAAEVGLGKYAVDEGNNALIVTDSALGLENTARLVKSLDRAPKQVLIEAKLVEVSLDNSLDYGIQWSGYGEKDGNYVGGGNIASNIGPASLPSPGRVLPGYSGALTGVPAPLSATGGGTGVNLPANLVYGAFRLGKVASNYMFDTVITAAAKKGKAKVLSNPKVATLNN